MDRSRSLTTCFRDHIGLPIVSLCDAYEATDSLPDSEAECDRNEGGWRSRGGPDAALGNGESQKPAMLRMGSRVTRHPHLGSCGDTGGEGRVYVRKLVVWQRLRLSPASLPFPFGNGRAAAGGHGVNTLMRRGLRENAKSGPLTPRPGASGVCPALFGVRPVVVRVTKCYPCGDLQTGCAMEYDQDRVDDMVLALLSLTMFDEDQNGARAWKGHDWVAMDRLHAKGYISDAKSKAKSVVVTATGVQRCRELIVKHFGKKEP